MATVDENYVRQLVERVISSVITEVKSAPGEVIVPVNMSNRHVHIRQDHLETLFGKGAVLTTLRPLMQPGEFASEQTLTLAGPSGVLQHVRLLGPVRSYTQVEVSLADSFVLGVKNPLIRDSGSHSGTSGITLVGPEGSVTIREGLIIAQRHIHMTPQDAGHLGLNDGDWARVKMKGPRGLIFEKVLVRVKSNYVLEMHVDVEEANACGLKPGDCGVLCI